MQRNLGVPGNHDIRKKVRGSNRKLHALERRLDSILLRLPEERLPHGKSWRYHLASPARLVDSADSSFKLRRRFVQLLADRLVELDDSLNGRYRTLLFLSFPFLSRSRIEVCVDKEYFQKLLDNAGEPADWKPIGPGKNIVRDFAIALPPRYTARGYSRLSPRAKGTLAEETWCVWRE